MRYLQKGFLSIVTIILIFIISFLGIAVTYMIFGSSLSTSAHYQSDQAFYLAESGLQHATHKMLEPTVANRLGCNDINTTPITNSLGAGAYSVTSSGAPFYADTPTTLSGALTATATTIPVVSTAGYPTTGRIMVDNEFINYSAITATSFTNAIRGVDGSTATTHVAGTPIAEFQCTVISTGSVPNLATSYARRVTQQNVTLQAAWVVGSANGNFSFGTFNSPADNSWYNNAVGGGVDLYSVYMNSYADGWIVGQNGFVAHWLGSLTSTTTQTLNPAVSYRSVWCNGYNQCFSVGDRSGGTVIQNWNGTNWARATISGGGNTNLRSVMCNASNNCWAVGDNTGTDSFYVWNGSLWTRTSVFLSHFPYNGVYCNSANDCWAVGNRGFARRNGATWTNFTTGITAAQYNGITCNNTSDCWAVGQINGGRDLISHWNGSAWSRDPSNPTPIANLNSISCANANDCWAVGGTSTNVPVFVHYDGTSWTQFTDVTNGPFVTAPFNSVFIISPSTQPITSWQENFS